MIEEVDKFSEVMMQLAHTMYTRMTKAEYERDVAQGKISLSSAANAMNANVTQSAPQLGYGRFRDAEDESFPVPSSPSPLAPSQDGEYIKYRVHKPNVKKGTKTEARNAVKNKRPATRFGSKAAMTTPSSTMAVSSRYLFGFLHVSNTPQNACTFTFLQSGLTPGRIGPDSTITRSVTSLNKRYAQKLAETMVSPYAIIPSVPLTDTEVVVFFYQSVARPIVAMRLYARAWGPAHITEVLNDHRNVTYLRNTCSVKCITSINKGKKIFGPEWAVKMQEIFKEADDMKATDLIRFSDDENNSPKIVNADVRELAVGVKKMPELGKDGGIFTRCVEWCMQNDVAYTLSSVVNLAKDLQATELAAASE